MRAKQSLQQTGRSDFGSKGVVLTDEEAMAIRWHMGGFDNAVKGGAFGLSEVYDNSMLALLLHIADMKASHIDEVE